MKKRAVIKALISALPLLLAATLVQALDYPHTGVNGITCLSCHDVHGGQEKYLRVESPNPPQNIDDTVANNLCWSCHNDVVAPFMNTHSSEMIDEDYGQWSLECRDCHNPHQQDQFRAYGSEAYLATGAVGSVTTTSLTATPDPGWTPDEFKGLIVVPNLNKVVYNYRILGNTSDTLTVSGGATGDGIDLAQVTLGDTFAVVYGKIFKLIVARPDRGQPIDGDYANGATGDTCDVYDAVTGSTTTVDAPVFRCANRIDVTTKFLRDFREGFGGSNEHSFAGDVDGDGNFQGPCEICHTRTRHHRNNDDWPAEADHTHNVGIKCTFCHKHVNGFLPLGAGAHEVHLTKDFGPKITCSDGNWGCHGTYVPGSNAPNEVIFADGLPLCDGRPGSPCPNPLGSGYTGDTGTQVCANCHGEGSGLAKYYFFRPGSSEGEAGLWITPQSGEYTWDDTWLGELGEDQFCGSCHNETANPTPVAGPTSIGEAPNIVGDLAYTMVGSTLTIDNTYGFFVNGHGKDNGENYGRLSWQDDAATANPGAGRVCSDCHEYTKTHWSTSGDKRLKDGYENDADNTVCRKCHENGGGGPVFANGGPEWYRSDSYTNYENSAHGPGIPGDKGNLQCTQCHDPHGVINQDLAGNGALNPAMTKGYKQGLCFRCHSDNGDLMQVKNDQIANNRPGGHVSADDIEEAFSLADGHDLGSSFTISGKNYKLECVSCHNVHVVTGKYWDAEQNLSPVALPLGGFDVFGDEPSEKMDYYAANGPIGGTGGFYRKTAQGFQLGATGLSWDQGAYYQPPKMGGGLNYEFGGDVLPAYPKFCLTCHTNQLNSPLWPDYGYGRGPFPVNWGQGIGCTDNSVDPPDGRVECGARHGFGLAGTPWQVGDNGAGGFWGDNANPDALFDMNYVTRGRHAEHFMRWPYDSANRNAGINFVLACTDCHEAHRSNRSSMIRERFQVNASGACGSGSSPGENCADGGLWNQFCNACHYYYGEHHAGMSCGNASCHEVNSIHRIIHSGADSGSNTQLMLTAGGYESNYEPPTYTPEIESVVAPAGSYQLYVTFRESEYGSGTPGIFGSVNKSDLSVDTLSGALQPDDFWLIDGNGDNPRTITAVEHTAGSTTAVLTMSQPTIAADHGVDILAAQPFSIWGWYQGGYINAATGTIPAGVVSAGPWPTTVVAPPPLVQGAYYGRLEMKLNGFVDDSNQIYVVFSGGTYANPGNTGNLLAEDFVLNCGGRSIASVTHTAGDSSAVLTLNSIIDQSEIGVCTIAAAPASIFGPYGPAETDPVVLTLPPEPSASDLIVNWKFNEGTGTTIANDPGALGTQDDMHGDLTRNVQWVTTSTKPGAAAGDSAIKFDRDDQAASDMGAVQLNYEVDGSDGFPAKFTNVQETQYTGEFTFSVWIKPTALGCQEGQDRGLNVKLRRDIVSTQFWVKNWALAIMRFSDDGDPIGGNCTTEDATHDVLRFWVSVGDPADPRCDPWGGTLPAAKRPVSPAGYYQGNWTTGTCGDPTYPLPSDSWTHSFAQTETAASGAPTYSGVALQAGVWQQVVGTWDGRYIRIYIDGQLAAETDMGGTGDYIMLADPLLWGGDLDGAGYARHVSSFFAAGARPKWSTSGSPSAGATYWNANGFYDLEWWTSYIGEIDDVKYWKSALPVSVIQE